MLFAEARWFERQILRRGSSLFPMLNLGSQTLGFRTEVQPWIDRYLFARPRRMGWPVVHSDLQAGAGIDLVGDLMDPRFRAKLIGQRFRSVVCSNLLEHVEDPAAIAGVAAEVVGPGGHLLVSVPYRFPYHPDPIDTLFRPRPEALASLFPRTEVVEAKLVAAGTLAQYILGRFFWSPVRFLKDVVRRRSEAAPSAEAAAMRKNLLPWLFRPLSVSCVLLRKVAS